MPTKDEILAAIRDCAENNYGERDFGETADFPEDYRFRLWQIVEDVAEELDIKVPGRSNAVVNFQQAAAFMAGEIPPDPTVIIFGVARSCGKVTIAISSKRFWDQEHCVPDHWVEFDNVSKVEEVTEKIGLFEATESYFTWDKEQKNVDQVVAELEAEGFVRHKDFEEFADQGEWEL